MEDGLFRRWAGAYPASTTDQPKPISMPHLLAAISPHGFGHLAQCAPVLNGLRRRWPDLRLTLRSPAPRALLESRIEPPFELMAAADDFGMVQEDALSADLAASITAYIELHRHWPQRVATVATELAAVAPDLVLADVPYLTLAAAQTIGVPSVAMCCLNWVDILAPLTVEVPAMAAPLEQMRAAYAGADLFLRTAPAMPMSWLPNARTIGPVMAVGRQRRAELAARCGLAPAEQIVVVALGGVPTRPPLERWPHFPGVRLLVPEAWQARHPATLPLERVGFSFSDLIASSDLVLTKPGYGTFTEAAGSGVPVLWVDRGDWPEQPSLVQWLAHHGRGEGISRAQFATGDFGAPLSRLLAAGRHPAVAPSGVEQAVEQLVRLGTCP